MIRKGIVKSMWALLCLGLLLTGCGGSENSGSREKEPDSRQAEIGRYVEEANEEVDLFSRISTFAGLTDGTLEIFDHNNGFFTSKDNGKSWNTKPCPPVDEKRGDAGSQSSAIAPDGGVLWSYILFDEDTEASDDFGVTYRYIYISPEGKEQELDFPGLDGSTGADFLSGFWFSPDGILYAASFKGKLLQVDIESAKLTEILEADQEIQAVAFTEKYLAAVTDKKAVLYDRIQKDIANPDETLNQFIADTVGENSVRYTGGNYGLYVLGSSDDTIYLVCSDGIFRHTIGGGTIEKLLEGTLFSIGDPTNLLYGMQILKENEFLVQMSGSTSRIYYDPNMPSVPERTLRVFSMEKDSALQRAVNLFQRKHQDIYVQYETGLTGTDGKTREDVIKSLNTEIMAGNGPDILSLGELPIESYMEKGMLEDITSTIDQIKKDGNYFENIMDAYEKNEKTFAVPVRFDIPLMLGSQEEIKGITNLETLADAVKKLRERKPDGTIIDTYEALPTLKLLAMVSGPAWKDEDGKLLDENIRLFLEKAKEIYELEKSGLDESDMEYYQSLVSTYENYGSALGSEPSLDISQHATSTFLNPNVLAMGAVGDILMEYDSLVSVKKQAEGVDYGLLQGQGGKVFLPDLIVGVSSKSQEKDLAKEFMQMLLSADNLENVYGGFNVSRDAMEEQHGDSNGIGGTKYGSMGIIDQDGTVKSMDLYGIAEDEKTWLYDVISQLDTSYLPDNVLQDAVIEAGRKVLEENFDIAGALEEIKQKVQLYLSE